MVNAEWDCRQSILASANKNAKGFTLSPSHANTSLGRAAGAVWYWLLGAIRLTQQFSFRPGILEQMNVVSEQEWHSLQPGQSSGKELRLGLHFILELVNNNPNVIGNIRYVHAHKTSGSGNKASPEFDKKAASGFIRKGGQWTSHSEAHKDGSYDCRRLQHCLLRSFDSAQIMGGDKKDRQYIVEVVDPTTNMFKVLTSSVIASPAMPRYSPTHLNIGQTLSAPRTFKNLFDAPVLFTEDDKKGTVRVSGKGLPKLLPEMSRNGIKPCHRPPRACARDHTLATGNDWSKTGKLIQCWFKDLIAPAICNDTPLKTNSSFKMEIIKRPSVGTGIVTGRIDKKSVYSFKPINVSTLQNLARFGISAEKLASVKLTCREIMAGRMHVHPSEFGRQTVISSLIAIKKCLGQISDWTDGEAADRILKANIAKMAKDQLHELPNIIKEYYCKVHSTDLGNPVELFSRFDDRIRAHPTIEPLFSLERGIESWPNTIVEPIAVDGNLRPLERALKDTRMLSIQEQNLNLATLAAYRGALQWIIDNQAKLREKDMCLIRWFEERANYSPMDIEQTKRLSPRRGQKRKQLNSTSL